MRRILVVLLAVMLLGVGACADNGSSSSGSSNGSSSNGSSGSSNGSSSSNDGSSSFDASSNNGSSGSSNGGSSNGGSSNDGSGGTTATTTPGGSSAAPVPEAPPAGFTLPQPDQNGEVKVPDEPPKEIRDDSPRTRLSKLPPIPRGCLDDDLTLLDVFAPFVSIPLRLTYCLLYVGTVARLPSEINIRVTAPSFDGPTINVPLLAPDRSQRPLATVALLLLVVAVSITVGYALGRRRAQR